MLKGVCLVAPPTAISLFVVVVVRKEVDWDGCHEKVNVWDTHNGTLTESGSNKRDPKERKNSRWWRARDEKIC